MRGEIPLRVELHQLASFTYDFNLGFTGFHATRPQFQIGDYWKDGHRPAESAPLRLRSRAPTATVLRIPFPTKSSHRKSGDIYSSDQF